MWNPCNVKKRLAIILAALLMLFALSGCVKVDMELRLQPEDTVDGTAIMAFDKQMVEMSGMTVDDLLAQMGGDPADLPEGATVSTYDDGTFVGQQVDFVGLPLSEFSSGGGMDSGFNIVREDDNFIVSGAFDGTDIDPSMTEGMEPELKITVIFPGPVASANGEISGNSVTWVPEPGVETPIEAVGSAIASGGGGGSSTLIFILVGIAVVAGAAIAFVLIRSKKKQTPPPAYGQAYPPQGQQYPPQGQQFPPQGQAYPPQGQAYPPQGQQFPPQGQQFPPQGPPPGGPPTA
jgi:hypothetical protein